MAPDPAALRAARALRGGVLDAINRKDLDALVANLAGWFTTDLDVRAGARQDSAETTWPVP